MKNAALLTHQPDILQSEKSEFEAQLSHLKSDFADLWRCTSDAFAPFGKEYDPEEQRLTEAHVEEAIISPQESDPRSEEESVLQMQRLKTSVRSLVVRTIAPEHREKTGSMLTEFSDTGDDFVGQARKFDSDLEPEDIFQALRNLWIINSMQVAFDLPVCVSSSGLAYSLLYPYTDNYLDGASVLAGEKREFNRMFAGRLSGIEMPLRSRLARKVSELVGMIEAEYPRMDYPGVYLSLLAIHRAQERSLLQHTHPESLAQSGILEISVEKGGTSVLADAYVAKGDLSSDEAEFAFGYGVFLQLIDDLQDVDEDLRNRHQTLFTLAATSGRLESNANELVRFTDRILTSSNFLSHRQTGALAELVKRSCTWLILESIALNSRLYTRGYLESVEAYSPLRFAYVRKVHAKMRSKQRRMRMVFKGKRVS